MTSKRWRGVGPKAVVRATSAASRPRAAFDILLAELLDRTFLRTRRPDRCAHCGGLEASNAVLKPIGWGVRHAWLHDGCSAPWREARRIAAIAKMATMGIVSP